MANIRISESHLSNNYGLFAENSYFPHKERMITNEGSNNYE